MNKNLEIIKDYVEGNIHISTFQSLVNQNRSLRNLLNDYANSINNCIFGKDLVGYIHKLKDNIFGRRSLQEILGRILDKNKIGYIPFTKYREDNLLRLDMQPSWLDIDDDQGIFDKIIAELPKDLSRPKQIAWGKAKIKELFRYDKTYPRWIQSPEWPIVNGKPLVFSHQKKAGKDDERTYYYFYDPDTKEETVITQMY